jgi:hypothetical protein
MNVSVYLPYSPGLLVKAMQCSIILLDIGTVTITPVLKLSMSQVLRHVPASSDRIVTVESETAGLHQAVAPLGSAIQVPVQCAAQRFKFA